MYLKDQAILGIEWSAGARVISQLLHFIITIILARLLAPKDFGLMAMITVFTGFAGLFRELGFGAALIQKKNVKDQHQSSIYWVTIVSGFLLTGIFFAAAPFLAKFYNEPRLMFLTMFVSMSFVIGSLSSVQFSILTRAMDFKKLAIIEITSMIFAGSLAVVLAIKGFGVWSLAWQLVISTTITVILTWRMSDWRPKFSFDKHAVKELIGFSSNLLGFSVLNYCVRYLDNMLIGKFIGSVELGIYARAYSIMLMPLNQISATIGRVLFPSLSKIQDDKALTKQIYLKTISAIALITFPMMTGLLVVADSFVFALLGTNWEAVTPVLRIFTFIGLVQSIGTTVGWIYHAQGRTDLMFKWGIAAGTVVITGICIGIWIGSILAVAVCYAISNVLLLYPNFAIPGKLIEMTFFELVSNIIGILGCAIIMATGVFFLGLVISPNWSHWLRLALQVPFGLLLYFVLIDLFRLKSYFQVKKIFQERWVIHFNRAKR